MSKQLDLTFRLSILVRHPKSVDTLLVYGFVMWDRSCNDELEGGTLLEYDRWDTHWKNKSVNIHKGKTLHRKHS